MDSAEFFKVEMSLFYSSLRLARHSLVRHSNKTPDITSPSWRTDLPVYSIRLSVYNVTSLITSLFKILFAGPEGDVLSGDYCINQKRPKMASKNTALLSFLKSLQA